MPTSSLRALSSMHPLGPDVRVHPVGEVCEQLTQSTRSLGLYPAPQDSPQGSETGDRGTPQLSLVAGPQRPPSVGEDAPAQLTSAAATRPTQRGQCPPQRGRPALGHGGDPRGLPPCPRLSLLLPTLLPFNIPEADRVPQRGGRGGLESGGGTPGDGAGLWAGGTGWAFSASAFVCMRGSRASRSRQKVGVPSEGGLLPCTPSLSSPTAAQPSCGHLGGSKRLRDPRRPGADPACEQGAPVTFPFLARSQSNLSLEGFLENLNLVSHQLFIIREAYV